LNEVIVNGFLAGWITTLEVLVLLLLILMPGAW